MPSLDGSIAPALGFTMLDAPMAARPARIDLIMVAGPIQANMAVGSRPIRNCTRPRFVRFRTSWSMSRRWHRIRGDWRDTDGRLWIPVRKPSGETKLAIDRPDRSVHIAAEGTSCARQTRRSGFEWGACNSSCTGSSLHPPYKTAN